MGETRGGGSMRSYQYGARVKAEEYSEGGRGLGGGGGRI